MLHVENVIDRLWPVTGAAAWDASGLVSGSRAHPVSRILLAVDAVHATVEEAIETGADVLLVHHPLLFRGVTSVAEDNYKGALLARLIRADCALLAVHTNADVVADGVSAVLASSLGVLDQVPIVSMQNGDQSNDVSVGFGSVGHLLQPTTLGRFARELSRLLPATASGVRVAGDYEQPVLTVSLCGGAGDSLLTSPAVTGSDVYVTSDLRHHPASEAREQARIRGGTPALVEVSHWASEWLWLTVAAQQLRESLPQVEVTVSELRTDPWDFAIV